MDLKQALYDFLAGTASLNDAGRDTAREDIRLYAGTNIFREDRRPNGVEPISLTMRRIAGEVYTNVGGAADAATTAISLSVWSSDETNTSGQPEKLYAALRKLLHGYRGALNDDVTALAIHFEGEAFDRSYPPVDASDNWIHQKTFTFSVSYRY